MKAESDQWVVYTLVERVRRIDPRPPYQRGPVWNRSKQQLLIDTMLRNYDFPKLYLRALEPGGQFLHEVVDGQQRLRAIWEYFDDGFPLGRVSEDLPGLGNLRGKRFSELSQDAKDRLGFFKAAVVVLTFDSSETGEVPELEIRDLFLRLQEGDSLNAAEKRNAMFGPVRDYVKELADNHRLFPALGIPDRRYGWQELAAIALCLELADGPTDIKGADLAALYRREDFDPSGAVAVGCRRTLDYMADVASLSVGALRTRWGFVDMYLAIRVLLREEGELAGRQADVLSSHVKLEQERIEAAGALDELIAADDDENGDPSKRDLFNYVQAFVREGATRRNVAQRHDIYLKRLREDLDSRPWADRRPRNA